MDDVKKSKYCGNGLTAVLCREVSVSPSDASFCYFQSVLRSEPANAFMLKRANATFDHVEVYSPPAFGMTSSAFSYLSGILEFY